LPVGMWVACYFIFVASDKFLTAPTTSAEAVWWLTTDILSGVATIALAMYAGFSNEK